MTNTLTEVLAHQYEASLCALNFCITRCPDAIWHAPVAKWKYCQAVFHTVFFADYYVGGVEDQDAFKGQPFHLEHKDVFRDYEEFEDRPQVLMYEKPFVLEYVQHARRKVQDVIARETADVLAGPSGFSWRKCSRAELHVYNIRHIQHHAAQLSLRLRLVDANVDIPWVSHAWREG